jgi:hypothetical protein
MQRLLRLPLEFFERTPTGDIQARIFSVYRVREFLTGPLFRTALDLTTLVVVVPLLILISPTLSFLILGLTVLMLLATFAFLPRIGRLTRASVLAEISKNTVLIETVQGIRTVKALAIEPQQADAWNERVALSVERQRELVNASNQLQTITAPIERLFYMGVLLFGTWSILNGDDSITMGSMFAFVMLSNRATGPLIAAAQLLNTLELVRTAMADAASVLNQPPERPANAAAIRPRLAGHVSFENVTFTYPGGPEPGAGEGELRGPAGTLLGLVGRSGSGKSTVTRLLQGLEFRLFRPRQARRRRDARDRPPAPAPQPRRRAAGQLPVPRHHPREHRRRPPGHHLREGDPCLPHGRRRGVHRAPAEGLRHHDRGRLAQPVRRPAPAPRHRPRPGDQPAHPDPGRGDQRARTPRARRSSTRTCAASGAGAPSWWSATACPRWWIATPSWCSTRGRPWIAGATRSC